jgi:hypothetical protein
MDEITNYVTIADILDDIGHPHRRNRCACPIHDGDNKTAFSFTDWGFICHNCGASGGLIDLAVALRSCTRLDAYQYLRRLAGLPPLAVNTNWKPTTIPTPIPRKPDNPAWLELEAKIDAIERQRIMFTNQLVNARADSCKSKYYKDHDVILTLDQWYSIEQILQYRLQELDDEYTYWLCKFHQTPRKLNAA